MLFLLFFSVDSVHEFLCFHNIPVLVWNALNDSESYVRASAIHLIGSLACQSKLWTCLLQNSKVSEVFLKTFYFIVASSSQRLVGFSTCGPTL